MIWKIFTCYIVLKTAWNWIDKRGHYTQKSSSVKVTVLLLLVSVDAAVCWFGTQSADEEGFPGAPVLPADPSIRDGAEAHLHFTACLHTQGAL